MNQRCIGNVKRNKKLGGGKDCKVVKWRVEGRKLVGRGILSRGLFSYIYLQFWSEDLEIFVVMGFRLVVLDLE